MTTIMNDDKYVINKQQKVLRQDVDSCANYIFNYNFKINIGLCCDNKAEAMIVGAKGSAANHCFWRIVVHRKSTDTLSWWVREYEYTFTDSDPWFYGDERPVSDYVYRLTEDKDNYATVAAIDDAVVAENQRRLDNNDSPMTEYEEHDFRMSLAVGPFIQRCPQGTLSEPNKGWMHSFMRPHSNVSSYLLSTQYNVCKLDKAMINFIGFCANRTGMRAIGKKMATRHSSSTPRSKP